ncbi:hypothetical protein [Acidipila sp. EB88]|uniref:hypothetical protein n=1 Tax=Acidipila sp. EB88 TaxID=2305226 RepID=UPI000F97A8DD|nr:hypothetical protein [Acidipila sp. EB88]RRA47097.1 hypothetical protein D1Y84_01125 [Acidipila sp. EB88]
MSLTEGIAREEGFYVLNSRAQRNNNPGNIDWGEYAQLHGASHGDPRFAVFPRQHKASRLFRRYFQGLSTAI